MDNINLLKDSFNKINNICNDIKSLFKILELKIIKLKEVYIELIKNNNNNNTYLFGLDSLHFQGKLIDIELENMKKIFLLINNSVYCEYYKLYRLISIYYKNNIDKN